MLLIIGLRGFTPKARNNRAQNGPTDSLVSSSQLQGQNTIPTAKMTAGKAEVIADANSTARRRGPRSLLLV